MVAAAQSGALLDLPRQHLDILNLDFPTTIPGVDPVYVDPRASWGDDAAYDAQATTLATLFQENIARFDVSATIVAAGPRPA